MNVKPRKYDRYIAVKVDQQTWDELNAIREFQGVTAAETIRRALRLYLGLATAAGPVRKEIFLDAGTWSPDVEPSATKLTG
jgi:hypothetical protein